MSPVLILIDTVDLDKHDKMGKSFEKLTNNFVYFSTQYRTIHYAIKSLQDCKSVFVKTNLLLGKRRRNEFAREASKHGILDNFSDYQRGIELMKTHITKGNVQENRPVENRRQSKLEAKRRSEYVRRPKLRQNSVPEIERKLSFILDIIGLPNFSYKVRNVKPKLSRSGIRIV